jgi:hypothetical protein
MALLTSSTPKSDKSSSSNVDSVGTQSNGFGYITAASDSTCYYDRSLIPDALLS